MLARLANLGLVLLLSITVIAWGTSPCLLVPTAAEMCADDAPACCCCDEGCAPDGPGPVRGTDDCPACSTIGNMHELVPASSGPEIDGGPELVAVLEWPTVVEQMRDATIHASDARILAPPGRQFTRTVALLR